MVKATGDRSACPMAYSLDILGDKWVLLILRDMIFAGKSSYSEFLLSDEKISTNILASKLETMEESGLVVKSVAPDKKSKFLYRLTSKGIALLPVIAELVIWGSQFSPHGGNPFYEALRENKEETLLNYKEKLLNQV